MSYSSSYMVPPPRLASALLSLTLLSACTAATSESNQVYETFISPQASEDFALCTMDRAAYAASIGVARDSLVRSKFVVDVYQWRDGLDATVATYFPSNCLRCINQSNDNPACQRVARRCACSDPVNLESTGAWVQELWRSLEDISIEGLDPEGDYCMTVSTLRSDENEGCSCDITKETMAADTQSCMHSAAFDLGGRIQPALVTHYCRYQRGDTARDVSLSTPSSGPDLWDCLGNPSPTLLEPSR